MNQLLTMSNEQFALYIASEKARTHETLEFADKYYKWLEDKKPKPGVNVPESYWDGCGGSNGLPTKSN